MIDVMFFFTCYTVHYFGDAPKESYDDEIEIEIEATVIVNYELRSMPYKVSKKLRWVNGKLKVELTFV